LQLEKEYNLMSPLQELQISLLNRLTLEQVQEALVCLHRDQLPQDQTLKELNLQDWGLLHLLLSDLMSEKSHLSLH
jgi:hypothetical protein